MKQSRKDWIKNIAIIFLAIMLVLTFFSNTIMNYSLPAVATDVVKSGTVTAKIRGTGTLEADDPYKVTIQESRVIASVAVKEGDVVKKDQVLFYLEDKESTELEAAEKKLDEMVLAYTTALLAGEVSQQSYENIRSGNISSTGVYQTRINEAKLKVDSAQAAVDSAQATADSLAKQIAIAETGSSTTTDKTAALEQAKAAAESASSSLAAAKEKLAEAESRYNTEIGESETVLTDTMQEKLAEADKKKAAYTEQKAKFQEAMNLARQKLNLSEMSIDDLSSKGGNWKTYIEKLRSELGTMTQQDEQDDTIDAGAEILAADTVLSEMQKAYEDYLAAQVEADTATKRLNEKNSLRTQIPKLKAEVTNAQNRYNECQALVQSLTNEISSSTASTEKQKTDLTTAKIEAEAKVKEATALLEAAKKELTQLLTDVSKELDLSSQSSAISDQQKEVERLREKATGSTIVAPVAGTVNSISKTAGETTVPDEAVAIMQPEGKGYSMSFSVTNDQAKKVSVGETAELQNAWYYGDVTATLSAIRPDTQNPGQKKLLYFDVVGEVQAGQSISLSIGQRSANYDMVVPNSAIREDSNGKFILIVESKNSPLGNRYVATRVDVEVLASDDLSTAINAALYGYEYVITTANKPVEAGKQIRLADE